MPIHTSFGIMIFVLACSTSLLGITEKLIFALKTYSKRDPEGVMANWIGVLIIVFGVLVVYLATNYKYKRLPRPEDEMLLNETHTQEWNSNSWKQRRTLLHLVINFDVIFSASTTHMNHNCRKFLFIYSYSFIQGSY